MEFDPDVISLESLSPSVWASNLSQVFLGGPTETEKEGSKRKSVEERLKERRKILGAATGDDIEWKSDFEGFWVRDRSEGLQEILEFQGVVPLIAKEAAKQDHAFSIKFPDDTLDKTIIFEQIGVAFEHHELKQAKSSATTAIQVPCGPSTAVTRVGVQASESFNSSRVVELEIGDSKETEVKVGHLYAHDQVRWNNAIKSLEHIRKDPRGFIVKTIRIMSDNKMYVTFEVERTKDGILTGEIRFAKARYKRDDGHA